MPIILPSRRSNRPNHPSPTSKHRAAFAHECALDAFGGGAIHHLNSSGFLAREPLDDPDEDVDGREAVARWLKLAANLQDGEAADTAYQTADEIRRVLGLEWSNVIGREVAE